MSVYYKFPTIQTLVDYKLWVTTADKKKIPTQRLNFGKVSALAEFDHLRFYSFSSAIWSEMCHTWQITSRNNINGIFVFYLENKSHPSIFKEREMAEKA